MSHPHIIWNLTDSANISSVAIHHSSTRLSSNSFSWDLPSHSVWIHLEVILRILSAESAWHSLHSRKRWCVEHFISHWYESLAIRHERTTLSTFVCWYRSEAFLAGNVFEGFILSHACSWTIFFLDFFSFSFSAIFCLIIRFCYLGCSLGSVFLDFVDCQMELF